WSARIPTAVQPAARAGCSDDTSGVSGVPPVASDRSLWLWRGPRETPRERPLFCRAWPAKGRRVPRHAGGRGRGLPHPILALRVAPPRLHTRRFTPSEPAGTVVAAGPAQRLPIETPSTNPAALLTNVLRQAPTHPPPRH